MPVLKNKTQGRYVNIGRTILEDREMKLIDRGLYTTLLSLPDKWDFSISGLTKIIPDGSDAVKKSLERLIRKGYVTRTQLREHGKFKDICIEVHECPEKNCAMVRRDKLPQGEKPLAENPPAVKPSAENSLAENPTQLNNNKLNTNKLSTKGCATGTGKENKNGRKNYTGNGTSNGANHGWSDAEKALYGL